MDERHHTDILAEKLRLHDKRVIDVGCGDGALVRFLAQAGARPIGLDSPLPLLQAARAAGEQLYVCSRAEALPITEATIDIVVFQNSLHRLPSGMPAAALIEARRVLVPGGHAYVIETIPEGDLFELMALVEDETAARRAAYEAVCNARDHRLNPVADIAYECPLQFRDFDHFKACLIARDAAWADRIPAIAVDLAEGFRRLGLPRDDGILFKQPTRAHLLQKL